MDDTVTTPETKSTTISTSKMMGREVSGGSNRSGLGGKESKIGKLSRILRTTRVKVNETENQIKDHDRRIKINAEKITRIKKIIKAQKSDLAEKLSSLDQTAEFASVEKGLDEIIKTLQKERKAENKAAEAARKKKERDRAKSREKKLESGLGKGIKKVVGTVVKPFKSIFDKIFGFLLNVLIGRTVIKLIDWFGDKENQKKIKSLIRFIKDWWPALTAAVLIFGTGFGSLAGGLVSIIGGFIPKFLALSVKLAAAVAKNPFAIGAGLFAAGAVVPALFPQTVEDDADKQANKAAEEKGSAQAAEDLKNQKGGFFDFLMGGGQERKEQAQKLETGKEKRYGFFGELNSGGQVPGRGPNKDTIPAMLTPGEFVMSRGAVDKFGTDTLSSMNAMGGGTNNPKVTSGVTYANGGGSVRGSGAGSPPGGYSSGSLITDPFGALDRVLGQKFGVKMGGERDNKSSAPASTSAPTPTSAPASTSAPTPTSAPAPSSKGKQETSDDQTSSSIPAKMLGSSTFRDSGLLYLRSMLGGLGGRITEQDLSMASKDELTKAIVRAKSRTSTELRIAEQQLAEAKTKGFNKQILAERQSVVDRLKRGEVRVEYQDYYDGTKITPAAEDAKSILGKFWAATTENGGYEVINERYDFVDMKNPMAVLMGDSSGVSEKSKPGQSITLRQRLQAMHQLNPFARDMAVDMVIGEKPTIKRSMNNVMAKLGSVADSLTGNLFDFSRQGGKSLMNPSGQKQEEKVSKPTKPSSSPKNKVELLNAQRYAESKGKYFSSADGKTYASYQDALDAQKVKPAQISKSQPKINPTITPPVKPEPKVNLMELFAAPELPPAEPNGRNNIPPFSPTTAGSKQKTDLLGLLTGF